MDLPGRATVARSVDEALALAGPDTEVMIVGGGEIYRQTFDRADRLEITHVDVGRGG